MSKSKPEQIREEVDKQIKLLQAEIENTVSPEKKIGLQKGLGSLILVANKL